MKHDQTNTLRLPSAIRQRLIVVAGLETARQGRHVSAASIMRAAIEEYLAKYNEGNHARPPCFD